MSDVCGLKVIAKVPGSNTVVAFNQLAFTCYDGEKTDSLGTITLPAGCDYYITFYYNCEYLTGNVTGGLLSIKTSVSNTTNTSVCYVPGGRSWTCEHKLFSSNTTGTYTVYFELVNTIPVGIFPILLTQKGFFTLKLTETPQPSGKISAIFPNPGTKLQLNTSSSYTFTVKVGNKGTGDGRIVTEATITHPDGRSSSVVLGDEFMGRGEEKTYTLNYSFVNAGTYYIDFTVKTEIKGNLVVTDKCPL